MSSRRTKKSLTQYKEFIKHTDYTPELEGTLVKQLDCLTQYVKYNWLCGYYNIDAYAYLIDGVIDYWCGPVWINHNYMSNPHPVNEVQAFIPSQVVFGISSDGGWPSSLHSIDELWLVRDETTNEVLTFDEDDYIDLTERIGHKISVKCLYDLTQEENPYDYMWYIA